MNKRIIRLILEVLAGIAGNLIAGWIQQDLWSNVFAPERLIATLIGIASIIVLLAWFDSDRTPHVLWHWYAFWYLVDIFQYFAGSEKKHAPLSFTVSPAHKTPVPRLMKLINQDVEITSMLNNLVMTRNRSANRFLVIGDPGVGKSTVLRKLAYKVVRHTMRTGGINRPIPFLIELGNYSGEPLMEFFFGQIIFQSRHGSGLAKNLERLLEGGHILLLLDALDEAGGNTRRRKIIHELTVFLKNPRFQRTSVILTTRNQEAYNYLFRELIAFEIQELQDTELDDYLGIYCHSESAINEIKEWLIHHKMLKKGGIGRNPLWLKLIATGGSVQRVSQRAILKGDYGQFLDKSIDYLLSHEMYTKLEAVRSWQSVLPLDEQIIETKKSLAYLAYRIMSSASPSVGEADWAMAELSRWLQRRPGLSSLRPQDVLGLGRDSHILHFDPRQFHFRHRLLRNSLAAWKLRIDKQLLFQRGKLYWYIVDDSWWEALVLLGEMLYHENLDTYTQLIRMVLESKTDERRLILAMGIAQCSSESNTALHLGLIETLEHFLEQGTTATLKQAVINLAAVLDGKKISFLQTFLFQSSTKVQISVIDILSVLRSDYSVELLIPLFNSQVLAEHAVQAVALIGPIAVVPLLKAIQAESADIRISAYRSLGLIGDSRAVEPLIAAFLDKEWKVRATASTALQQLEGKAITELCSALHDQEIEIWAAAAETLKSMGDKVVSHLVTNLSINESRKIQVISAWVLWHLGESAAKPLSKILEGLNPAFYGNTPSHSLPMRVLGAMLPVHQHSKELVWEIRQELSPKAKILVGRVLSYQADAILNENLLKDYAARHPHEANAARVIAEFAKEGRSGSEDRDTPVYRHASAEALSLSREISDYSSSLRAAKAELKLKLRFYKTE